MSEYYQIAVDGPSGSGKSTLAKGIAKKLGILYLDTGAMYRACGLKAIKSGIDTKDAEKIEKMMQEALMRGDAMINFDQMVTPESVRCAQIIITTIPIVICYPFLQKYFIQGVTLGAVKD